jgi:hypothetical protein
MKYGSPQHGMRITTCAQGSSTTGRAPFVRTHPPPQPAQMMQGPAQALAVTSIRTTTSHRVKRRTLRAIFLTSTARLGVGP